MNIAEQLKTDYPKTWEEFRNYLRNNYEFWEEESNDKTLWFCERDFRTQCGYFMDWISYLGEESQNFDILSEEEQLTFDEIDNTVECLKFFVPKLFRYLESRA